VRCSIEIVYEQESTGNQRVQRKREMRGDSGEAANENDLPVILDKYP
jgi:hypothetical protein